MKMAKHATQYPQNNGRSNELTLAMYHGRRVVKSDDVQKRAWQTNIHQAQRMYLHKNEEAINILS